MKPHTLPELITLPDEEFVDAAYNVARGRLPTVVERQDMLARLRAGTAKTSLLDSLMLQSNPSPEQPLSAHVAELSNRVASLVSQLSEVQVRLGALFPSLGETLEIAGPSLVDEARRRVGVPAQISLDGLSPDARYALFQSVFYESAVVAVKQRVYLPYIDTDARPGTPFLDLGCGRGEFLRILREHGVDALGVDLSSSALEPLRRDGFDVIEKHLIEFLETDSRTFSGASVLQVVEHITEDEMQRMLALLSRKLTPGAPLIIETPNPLSPFALGHFHTDPTHLAPIPPERMRFEVELAGFERARILFQGRIPQGQFAGPDPRSHYVDYAVIAYRSR